MDGAEILAKLRDVDPLTLRFSPFGLGGSLAPEQSARFLAESVESIALSEDVPEDVRSNVARVRKLHLYGLLDYDFFTVAIDQAHLVLEGALRNRFVSFYGGRVPVVRDGVKGELTVRFFAEVFKERRRAHKKKVELSLDDGSGEPVPGSYSDLFAWARRAGLLPGQRNAGVFRALVALRNHSAHPEGLTVEMPPESVRTLRDVTEIVNKLWGHDSVGGRLYPPPVRREARVAALAPDGERAVTYSSLERVRIADERDWTFAVFLASPDEELVDFRLGGAGYQFVHEPGVEKTHFPVTQLLGPSSWTETVAALDDFAELTDEVRLHDRLFFIRAGESIEWPDWPRSPSDLLALDGDGEAERWYAIVADHALDAWGHVRTHGDPGPERDTCRKCAARVVARVDSRSAARELAAWMP